MLKIIFLDIDGVLNDRQSKSRCRGFIGIDDDKVKRLWEIVTATNAKIVLCSSWKSGWELQDKDSQNELANYLDRKLKREGLFLIDKTKDSGSDRGNGIIKWLETKNVSSWIVLDDEIFSDYEECGIIPYLIKTSFYCERGGLQPEHVDKAIQLLRGVVNE